MKQTKKPIALSFLQFTSKTSSFSILKRLRRISFPRNSQNCLLRPRIAQFPENFIRRAFHFTQAPSKTYSFSKIMWATEENFPPYVKEYLLLPWLRHKLIRNCLKVTLRIKTILYSRSPPGQKIRTKILITLSSPGKLSLPRLETVG